MGELMDFRPRTNVVRRIGAGEASAEILFFTGVRIMRVEESDPVSKGKRRRAAPRSDPPRKRRSRKS
ncbi:hypothetical protein MHY1_00296 [Methylovirgula sp. HY1]|nr:hypothetical protein MHY1_00296 [Methylovirgula sp. HY1]